MNNLRRRWKKCQEKCKLEVKEIKEDTLAKEIVEEEIVEEEIVEEELVKEELVEEAEE